MGNNDLVIKDEFVNNLAKSAELLVQLDKNFKQLSSTIERITNQVTASVNKISSQKIKIEVDNKQAVKALNDIQEESKKEKHLITTVLIRESGKGIKKIGEELAGLYKNEKNKIQVDINNFAEPKIKSIKAAVLGLSMQKMLVDMDIKDAIVPKLDSVKNYLRSINDMRVVSVIQAMDYASEKVKNIKAKASELYGQYKEPIKLWLKEYATERLNEVKKGLLALVKSPYTLAIKAISNTDKVISGIKSALSGLKGFASTLGIGDAIKNSFTDSMNAEDQQQRFANYINTTNHAGGMNKSKQEASQYAGWLSSTANSSAFERGQVSEAGNQAIELAEGNISKAQELVKLAENMAASRPGKSMSDAMEALKELKSGNTSKMDEFGVKVNPAALEGANKKGAYENIVSNQLNPAFKGNADNLANTTKGQMNIIKNSMLGAGSSVAGAFLPLISKGLMPLANWLIKNQKLFSDFGKSAASHVASAVKVMQPYASAIFNWANKNLPQIGKVVNNVFSSIGGWLRQNMPAISKIVVGVINGIKEVIIGLKPVIGAIINVVKFLVEVFLDAWPLVSNIIKTAWSIIKPIFKIFADEANIIVDIFKLCWPTIKEVVSDVWEYIKPVIELIAKGLEKVSNVVGAIGGWIHKKVGQLTGKSNAWGQPRVPYDNYPAILHEGERVLTKQEAQQMDNGSNRKSSPLQAIFNINGAQDPEKIARVVAAKLEEFSFNMA